MIFQQKAGPWVYQQFSSLLVTQVVGVPMKKQSKELKWWAYKSTRRKEDLEEDGEVETEQTNK